MWGREGLLECRGERAYLNVGERGAYLNVGERGLT